MAVVISVPAPTEDAQTNSDMINAAIRAAHEEYLKNPSAGQVTVQLAAGEYVVTADPTNPSVGAVELLSGVSLVGAGMGETIIKLQDNFNQRINGIVRTALETVEHVTIANLTIDGNRDNNTGHQAGFICGVKEDGSGRIQSDITLSGVEIMNCSAYGFNPHEVTYNVVIENCVAHNNGLDGFVADYVVGGVYRNNLSYDNDRHGFNIQNATSNLVLENNSAYDNGSAGIVVQRGNIVPAGQTTIPWVSDIQIIGGEYYRNAKEGILVKLSDTVTVDGALIHDNLRQGVRIEGSTNTILQNSTIYNNSQEADNTYDEVQIRLRYDDVTGQTYYSTDTQILNNTIYSNGAINARYGVREEPTNDDGGPTGTIVSGNAITGMDSGAISVPNYIWVGTEGDDTIEGTTGGEEMRGYGGDDTYIVNHSGDLVVEAAGEGTDTVLSSITYYLPTNVENLVLTGSGAINGHGNEQNNLLIGNSSSNTLKGYDGDDTIEGGIGTDALYGGSGNDTFRLRKGEFGDDTIFDFSGNGDAPGDVLEFIGFSSGAILTQTGVDTWTVTDGSYTESFKIAGGATVHSSDHNLTTPSSEPEPPPPATEFPAIGIGTTQMEALALDKFTLISLSSAQGGQAIENRNKDVEATAKGTFTRESGTYKLTLAYYDENDGASPMGIRVNGALVDSWIADQQLGSSGATSATLVSREVVVALNQNDTIEIFGTRKDDELVRVDALSVEATSAAPDNPVIANADSYEASKDTQLIVAAAYGVLANDIADDGGLVAVAGTFTTQAGGTVELKSDGSFTYTSLTGFSGEDAFTYTARDVDGDEATGSVQLTVAETASPPALPVVSIGTGTPDPQTEGATARISFTLTLDQASTQDVTVSYSTVDGTAIAGSDFVGITGGSVTFAPGETSKTITVDLLDDTVVESPESFTVRLGTATNATVSTISHTATGNIADDDTPPTVSISSVSPNPQVEGSGAKIKFTLTLDKTSTQEVSVRYSTLDGTAIAGSDYKALVDKKVTFLPGQTSKTITVELLDDTLVESPESFTFKITSATNATVSATSTTATGTIVDNDMPATVAKIYDTTVYKAGDPSGYGSGDPSGLAYVPGTDGRPGTLFIADSEHDESPYYSSTNLLGLNDDGSFSWYSMRDFTKEPTGLAYNPANGCLYITDDDKDKIFWVDPANPSVKLGEFDLGALGIKDAEDPTFNLQTGDLFLLDGAACKLVKMSDTGALLSSVSLPSVIKDAEALAYSHTTADGRAVFFVAGGTSTSIYQVDETGALLAASNVLDSYTNPVTGAKIAPKGMEFAPSSDPNDRDKMNLYVADHGVDQKNDGRVFEIDVGSGWLIA